MSGERLETGPPTEIAREALDLVGGRRGDFLDLVRDLAVAESPSTVPGAQAAVRDRLSGRLESLGFRVEHVPGVDTGGHLLAVDGRAATGGGAGPPRQLLLGHMDTVWPVGTLHRMPLREEDGRLHGPGVFDMKAGLAMGLTALGILRELGIRPPLAPVFLITSDEEIGSPESGPVIVEWGRAVERVLVLEPALGPEGKIKTRRKGVATFTVTIHGRSAHGGLAPEEGASAILELAHVIRRLDELGDADRGITVNVGVVEGGERSNVVPAHARAEVDVRAWSREDADRVARAIRSIEPVVPGTRIEIAAGASRPPLEKVGRNATLWDAARGIGEGLGWSLEEGSAGGGSDGNLTSLYTATLDGLGAVGDGAHASHEFISIEPTLERIALLAGILALPAPSGEPPDLPR